MEKKVKVLVVGIKMYWQYVVWCRRYTGLYYFTKDCPPITEEIYMQVPSHKRYHEDTLKEAILQMQTESNIDFPHQKQINDRK